MSILLNILCFLIFIVHISLIGYKSLYPDVPEIVVYKKDLSEIDFPLLIRICLFEKENINARFLDYGYDALYGFFHGQSMYNSSLVGWAGHTENGSTIGSVEGNFHFNLLNIKFLKD